jgi:membrane protein implicated in regulation of membrane protease activity/DNA-binding ferritin-like protein (Dps family)
MPEEVADVMTACERYWREAGLPKSTVADMSAELQAHLHEAAGEGKTPEDVIGTNVADFAEAWARSQAGDGRELPTWEEVWAKGRREGVGVSNWLMVAGIVAVIVLAIIVAPEEGSMDDVELFRWIWIGATLFLGVAEMVTAGFFMLPFAVGAAAAALLAFVGVAVWAQFVVFIVVSIAALIGLQRFVRHEDEAQPTVGANRYLDKRATVIEEIDRVSGRGRVRMDTEDWRATTDGDDLIPAGIEVRVVDVRGTRLVVESGS